MSNVAPAGGAHVYSPGLRGMAERLKDRFTAGKAGTCISGCKGDVSDLDCAGLAREEAKLADARNQAMLADAAYGKPGERTLPPGHREATDAELQSLELMDATTGRKLTEMPGSNFGSSVFKNEATGEYTVAFKGTTPTSWEDWKTNAGQGMGRDTRYYSQAIEIARNASSNAPGKVRFAGHSLGGGMASAAAAATGSRAATFNAAGLHPNTVPNYRGGAPIDAYYVKGDILSGLQDSSGGLMSGAAGRRLPLGPASSITGGDAEAAGVGFVAAGPIGAAGAGVVARGVRLHGMPSVMAALADKQKGIDALQRLKGCPQ